MRTVEVREVLLLSEAVPVGGEGGEGGLEVEVDPGVKAVPHVARQ